MTPPPRDVDAVTADLVDALTLVCSFALEEPDAYDQ